MLESQRPATREMLDGLLRMEIVCVRDGSSPAIQRGKAAKDSFAEIKKWQKQKHAQLRARSSLTYRNPFFFCLFSASGFRWSAFSCTKRRAAFRWDGAKWPPLPQPSLSTHNDAEVKWDGERKKSFVRKMKSSRSFCSVKSITQRTIDGIFVGFYFRFIFAFFFCCFSPALRPARFDSKIRKSCVKIIKTKTMNQSESNSASSSKQFQRKKERKIELSRTEKKRSWEKKICFHLLIYLHRPRIFDDVFGAPIRLFFFFFLVEPRRMKQLKSSFDGLGWRRRRENYSITHNFCTNIFIIIARSWWAWWRNKKKSFLFSCVWIIKTREEK